MSHQWLSRHRLQIGHGPVLVGAEGFDLPGDEESAAPRIQQGYQFSGRDASRLSGFTGQNI
jgi:hypothetical protein